MMNSELYNMKFKQPFQISWDKRIWMLLAHPKSQKVQWESKYGAKWLFYNGKIYENLCTVISCQSCIQNV